MDIKVINRSEEIIDPSMNIVDKIGKMARLCYRVDNDTGHDTNVRIVSNCIKSGHESVVEHGILSLFINGEITADSENFAKFTKGNVPVPFLHLWNSIRTDASSKYSEMYDDPDMFEVIKSRHNLPNTERRMLPCIIADVRGWRQILMERIFLAGQHGDVLSMLLLIKIVSEFVKATAPDTCLFEDVVKTLNSLLENPEIRKGILIGDPQLDEYTIEKVADHYFTSCDTVCASVASPTASLSVILTTDRATTHQLVRHRKNVAYSQESQRYVNYDKKGYGVIPLTVESSNYPEDLIEDYNLGRIRSTSAPYLEWMKAMQDAFEHYHNLLHIYDNEFGQSDGLTLKPEVCRGVLPNDTATRIGVTWMNRNSFINFVHWRLDKHAQYAIRSTVARIIYKAKMMHHPFIESIPYKLLLKWLNSIKEQKLFNGQMAENLEKMITETVKLQAALKSYTEKIKKEEEEEMKKDETVSDNEDNESSETTSESTEE